MKWPIFLFLLCLNSVQLKAQTYASNYEEQIFKAIEADSVHYDFFGSLLAIDSTMTTERAQAYQAQVDKLIQSFPPKEDKEKKEKKRIESIYDELHDAFFRKYDLYAYFNDVFENGNYNCVTATALYAYAFDRMGVPFHVKEAPSHVFLVVYPNTYKIYLETTVPGAMGFVALSDSEVKKMVDELVSYKLITDEEVKEQGYRGIYESYFYGKEYIDKKALIGMEYYNKGVFDYQEEAFDRALNNFKKARKFYTSPVVELFMKEVLFTQVNDLEMNTKEDIDVLMEIIAVSDFKDDYTKSNLTSSLNKIVYHDDNDKDFILYVIDRFSKVEDPEVREISLEYLYEYLAQEAARDEDLTEALTYGDLLFQLNPKNKIGIKVIEYVCFRKVGISALDLGALEDFEGQTEKYPFLKENNRYHLSLGVFYANLSISYIITKEMGKTATYMEKLEHLLDTTDVLEELNKGMLAELYIKAGNFYYYKEQYKTAYTIYKKGLSYIPDHAELNKRLGWAKEEL